MRTRTKYKSHKRNYIGLSGRCGLEAVGFIFDLDAIGAQRIFQLSGSIDGEGCSTQEARKAISILCDLQGKQWIYVTNQERISCAQFHTNHKHEKGIEYITNHDGHLSTYKNGCFFDNFGDPSDYKLLGWWRITKKGFQEQL